MTVRRPFRLLNVIAAADIGGTEVLCRELMRRFAADDTVAASVCCVFPGTLAIKAQFEEVTGRPLPIAARSADDVRFHYIRAFHRLCCEQKPDGIVMHFFGLDVVLLALAARFAGVRAITTKAGNPAPSWQHAPLQALKWAIVVRLLRALRVPIVSSSAWIQTSLEKIARLPAGSCVIHNGASYGAIDMSARLARATRSADPAFVIGSLARLERIKDVPTLLQAVALFKAAKPHANWRLEVAGDGPLRDDLERMSQDLGLHSHVAFLGLRQDVYHLLGSWDLFLFSTTRDEGFGIVLVEAMAAGLEILASDVPACREVLGDGAFGKLFPSGDAQSLADAISRAYDAREEVRPSARGRDSFDISVCASRHLALIQHLAGSRG